MSCQLSPLLASIYSVHYFSRSLRHLSSRLLLVIGFWSRPRVGLLSKNALGPGIYAAPGKDCRRHLPWAVPLSTGYLITLCQVLLLLSPLDEKWQALGVDRLARVIQSQERAVRCAREGTLGVTRRFLSGKPCAVTHRVQTVTMVAYR